MEDDKIVGLYWERDESAIRETEKKYDRYLNRIAYNVLWDVEDSRESVNDTYLKAWDSMPPHRPGILATYLGKITRQTSIDKYRKKNSHKRRCSEYVLSLSELGDCVSGEETPEQAMELQVLAGAISTYLHSLSGENRNIFVCRYYFMDSIRDIAGYCGASESKIKSSLYRMRNGLRTYLEEEGFTL